MSFPAVGRKSERSTLGFAEHRIGRTEQFRPAPDLMEFLGRPLLVGVNPDAVVAMPTEASRETKPVQIELTTGQRALLTRILERCGNPSRAAYFRGLMLEDARKRGLLKEVE